MTTHPLLFSVVMILVTCAIAAGCASKADGKDEPAAKAGDAKALHGSWRLAKLQGQDVPDNAGITLNLQPDNKVGGSGGVNRFFGTYAADDTGGLRFSPLGSTKRAGPPEAMKRESAVFGALSTTTNYRLHDDSLEMSDGQNALLVWQRAK